MTGPAPARDRFRKLLRSAVRAGARVFAAGCLLGLLLVGALQSDGISTWVVSRLAGRFNPYPGTRLTVDRVSGSWIRSLRLEGVRLVPTESREAEGPELALDTLAVRFRLLPLLVRRLEVREATVTGLEARLTQRPDSLWDFLLPFRGGVGAVEKEDGRGGFRVRTGPIRIQDSALRLTFAPDSASAVPDRLEVEALTVLLASLDAGGDGLAASLDTIYARFLPPGEGFDPVFLEGKGSLADGRVVIPGLSLQSGLSDVSAEGTLLLPQAEDGEVEEIDFHLSATPLAFRDLHGFLRSLDPAVTAQLELRLQGRSSRLEASLRGALSNGGSLELDGSFSPSASGPVEYRLQATAQDLGLESFLGRGGIGGVVGGQVTVDLEGRDPAHLTGDVSGRVEGLRIADLEAGPLVISGGILDGEADLAVEAGMEGFGAAHLAMGGRPLDPEPTLKLQGTFRQTGAPAGPKGNPLDEVGVRELETRFAIDTKGYSLDSAVAELGLELLRGTYHGLNLEGGKLTGSWSGGAGSFELRQPVGMGRVTTSGEIAWRGPEGGSGEGEERVLTYSFPDLELRNLDLLGLLGDTVPSRVNAQVSLTGVGTELGTLRANAQIRLRESEIRGIVVDSAQARPGLEAGAVTAVFDLFLGGGEERSAVSQEGEASPGEEDAPEEGRTAGEMPGGRIHASLQGRPFDAEPYLILDSLAFSGIDLETIAGLPSHLSGLARGRMDGFDPRASDISGSLRLSPSRIRDTSVESGDVALTLSGGALHLSGQVTSTSGALRLAGSAHPFSEPLEFQLDEGEVRELDLGTVLGKAGLHSDLNLHLSLSGSGNSLPELQALGNVVILPSTLSQGSIRGGSIALEASGGRGTAQGEIRTGEGEVTLRALASLTERLNDIRAEGDLDLPDLGGFLGRSEPQIEASGKVAVTWTDDDGLGLTSELEGRIGEASIDTLDIRASLGGSDLRLDTLRLRSQIMRADGAGRLALRDGQGSAGPSDLRITADVLDLSPLGPLLGVGEMAAGSGQGEFHVTGPAGDPSLSASLDLGPWVLRRVSADSARVRADYDGENMRLAVWIQAPGEGGSMDLALQADPRPAQKRGTLERLDFTTPAATWALDAPAPFSWKDGFLIDGFVLSSAEGRISVDGSIDPRGDQDLTLQLGHATLSGLARLLGLEDLTLLADGQLALTGPAASPMAKGDLRLELALPQGTPTAVDAHFSLADGELTLDARAENPAGGTLTLDGSMPLAFSLAPKGNTVSSPGQAPPVSPRPDGGSVDLTLRGQDFDIAWARALVPHGAVAALQGVLSADARATGPIDQMVVEGTVGLEGGMIYFPLAGTRYQAIDLSAEFRDQGVRITRASITSGPGTAEIQGFVALREFRPENLDLTARMDRFLALHTPSASATLTGALSLRGTLQEPRLAGNLNIEGTKLGLDNASSGSELQAVDLTDEDYRMLEDYFDYRIDRREVEPSRLAERFGLDISLTFDRDVWVNRARQPRVSLEVRGDLAIQKEPMGAVLIVGTVETLPERSYFRQFGRRFSVQEGELTLTGDPSEFTFRMDAKWEVPSYSNPDEAEVVVNLEVNGSAESLELTLSSDPAMDEADIVSYLATGRPQTALTSADTDAGGIGTSMAIGAMAGVLEGLASDAVELDVVEIKVDPVKGTTLIAGRYVSPNLYLGFRQPVTFSESNKRTRTQNQSSEVEVEYRWFRWLTMNVQGGASEIRMFLKARYAY